MKANAERALRVARKAGAGIVRAGEKVGRDGAAFAREHPRIVNGAFELVLRFVPGGTPARAVVRRAWRWAEGKLREGGSAAPAQRA